MSEAVRVGDLTAHGTPIQGQGSPDVFIGNMKAWRAIPADVGGGLEEASKKVKAIMDKFPSLPSPSDPAKVVTQDLTEIFEKMLDTAAKAEDAAKMCGALAGVQSAFMSFQPTAMGLLATYTSAAAAPGAEPGARLAFTAAFQAGLGATMSAAVTAIAGAWDMNNCPATIPGPPPHGPGLVTVGCKTIFINGLPAVVKGHQIIEAAGGPNAIQIGCSNVFFGDKAPTKDSGPPPAKKTTTAAQEPDEEFPDLSNLGGGPVIDPATGQPVLLAANGEVPGLLQQPVEIGYEEFKRAVLDRQIANNRAAGRPYYEAIPDAELTRIEGSFRLRTAAAADCVALLAAVRAALASENAGGNDMERSITVGLSSAYRDYEYDAGLWDRYFGGYYRQTQSERDGLQGGPHGPAAVRFLARYIAGRKAAPGFSNHSDGRAVDFYTIEGGVHYISDSGTVTAWRATRFYQWLVAHASEYNFSPLTSEPWHWNHSG